MEVLRQNFYDIPIITRYYTTACVITALSVHLELVSPLQLYFNPRLIISNLQIWRLATTFLYFGPVGFSFFFNIIFTYRYCRMLEEGSFRGRTSDFLVMILFGSILMILLAMCVNLVLLGQAFTIMLVYIWSRRNTFIRLNFFGLLNFQAPYLPWVLLCFSMILGNTVWVDLVGMSVGHMYYFLEDVLPCQRGGCKLLRTPRFLKLIFNEIPNISYVRPVANQPGGFNWGPQNMMNYVRAVPEGMQEDANEE